MDFKELISEAYPEFSHTWKIKIFAEIVNAFEYNDVVSRPVSKRFARKIYEVYWTEDKVFCVNGFRGYYLQEKAKQKSKLGQQEFMKIVKILKNIISEHSMLKFCQKYSEIIVRARRLVVSDFVGS